jgi:hypothetical protein
MIGSITARAEAQTLRFSLVYALLDQVDTIGLAHLKAGIAVWDNADRSARYIFGDRTGHRIADTILAALRTAAPDSLTRNEIRELLGHSIGADRIDQALQMLLTHNLAQTRQRSLVRTAV